MHNIDTYNFKGKRVLIRVDFNIPMSEKLEIVDDIRILATLPTINKVLSEGGSVILLSHLGRPVGYDKNFSLGHLVDHLEKVLNVKVKFSENCIGEETKAQCSSLLPGEVILLENVRFHKEEKYADDDFAQELAVLGDVYINDAFGTSHRDHASVTTVARFFNDKMMGYVMRKEVQNADTIIKNPDRPFTAILGGAKVSDKIDLIDGLLERVDNMLIGGGMANTFIKSQGGHVGDSVVEEDKLSIARDLMKKASSCRVNLILPSDVYIADRMHNEADVNITGSKDIPKKWLGLDIGPQTQEVFREVILKSRTILWNGPLGVYEIPRFSEGTNSIAESVAKATILGAFSLIGGGDSASAIHKLGYQDKVSYISTGGGALLSFIVDGTLPGINALEME